jgi:hypothetical protein
MADSTPDLKLIDWTVPVLTSATDDGPKCPEYGTLQTFVSFPAPARHHCYGIR